jgi:hypothetical protein
MEKYSSILEKNYSVLENILPKWKNIDNIHPVFSALEKYSSILENIFP